MARVLVAYYSRTGTTKKVAAQIAGELGADLEPIVDVTPRAGLVGWVRSALDATLRRQTELAPARFDPRAYDLVVIASPIWNASISTPARTYVLEHRDELKSVAFACTCGGHGGARVLDQLAHLTRKEPLATLVVREIDVARGAAQRDVQRFARDAAAALERGAPRAVPSATHVPHPA